MTTLAGHRAATRSGASLPLRLLAAPVTAVAVAAGVWLTGAVVTNDFALAMSLTAVWMAVAGLLALAIAVRSRSFRLPVAGGYGATAVALAVLLGGPVLGDQVVDEQVAVADSANLVLGAGSFQSVRHEARGAARVLELAAGGRALTLTDFAVDNGPDLRVYLVAGPASTEDEVDDLVDLGGLKGNRGNQQYAIPASVDLDRYSTVVIWCRAFTVLFARAPLMERSRA
jgi:hypothetical protein